MNGCMNPLQNSKDFRRYDFGSSRHLSLMQMQAIKKLSAEATEALTQHVSNMCRRDVTVKVQAVSEVSLEMNLALKHDSQGTCPIDFVVDTPLAFCLIDIALGGDGQTLSVSRPLSLVERSVAAVSIDKLASIYADIWQEQTGFHVDVTGKYQSELNRNSQTTRVIQITFSVTIGSASGTIHVYIPLIPNVALLDAVCSQNEKLTSRGTDEDRERALVTVGEVDLPISAVVGTAKVSLSEIVNMSVGDVICLNARPGGELQVWTAGRPALTAFPMEIDGKMGIRICSSAFQKS
jgi:flagellar motor switch protein FliM